MTSFMVVRIEGDVPDDIVRVAYETTGGVLRAWNVVTPDVEKRVDVEVLTDGAEEKGPRQRHKVLSRIYKEGWDSDG